MTKITISALLVLSVIGVIAYMSIFKEKKDPFENINQQHQSLLQDDSLKVATFSGGCFWCMEGPFESLDGVTEVISGFAGGTVENPTYEQVVGGSTDHRESVQVFYNPNQITFAEILKIYWQQIDPTDAQGQFADRGNHYTTAIFYQSPEDQTEAERQVKDLNEKGIYDKPIVTQVLPFSSFYPAEEYHQDFYKKSATYYSQYKKGSGRQDYIDAAKKYW